MSRTKSSTALLLIASIALAAGCTRNDSTAPSELPPPSLDEHQGANN